MIQGEREYLEDPAHARAIRVFLFSGVRAGILWRQSGGRMWELFLMRGTLLQAAQGL